MKKVLGLFTFIILSSLIFGFHTTEDYLSVSGGYRVISRNLYSGTVLVEFEDSKPLCLVGRKLEVNAITTLTNGQKVAVITTSKDGFLFDFFAIGVE